MTKKDSYPRGNEKVHGSTPSALGRLASKVHSSAERQAPPATGSAAHISEIAGVLSASNVGVLTRGQRLDTRLDMAGIASRETREGRRQLSHLIIAGQTVFGVVASFKNEGSHYEVTGADVVVLPLGLNLEDKDGAPRRKPVTNVGSVNVAGLPNKMERGVLVPEDSVALGRHASSGTIDPTMSARHAKLDFLPAGRLKIEDESSNGTFVLEQNTVGTSFGLQGAEANSVFRLFEHMQMNPHLWDPELAGEQVIVVRP